MDSHRLEPWRGLAQYPKQAAAYCSHWGPGTPGSQCPFPEKDGQHGHDASGP